MYVLLSLLVSLQASAQSTCSTVWVYKPFKTCTSPLNGPDASKPGEALGTRLLWSDWVEGGQDQTALCTQAVAAFNEENKNLGLEARLEKPTPSGEEHRDAGLRVIQYRYACETSVSRFPFKNIASAACGTEDRWASQVGGSAQNLPGVAQCLSCDEFTKNTPEAMARCLRDNIVNVIEPRAIELRDSDRKAVAEQVRKVLSIGRALPIEGLKSVDELTPLTQFLANEP
jgi:hypothetical protein